MNEPNMDQDPNIQPHNRDLKFATINMRGLSVESKRKAFFSELSQIKCDVVLV